MLLCSSTTDGLPVWLIGLAPAAVSVVVIAAVRLWQKACVDNSAKNFVAAVSACVVLATQGLSSLIFPGVMASGGLFVLLSTTFGYSQFSMSSDQVVFSHIKRHIGIHPIAGALLVLAWLAGLVFLAEHHPRESGEHSPVSLFYIFYYIGSIIFGGGQVMIPMLLNDIVMGGWVSKEQFLVGLALVQSSPGPLFNISAYLGALIYGVPGALISSVGLFSPGIILFFGLLPLWERVRHSRNLQIFLSGVNASATGLIVASFFLLWDKAVRTNASATVGLATALMVGVFHVPTSVAIIGGAILGFLLSSAIFNIGQNNFCS